MDLSGKIISQLPEVSGSSKSGNAWRKQEFIVETGGQYPKKVCVSLWGDKIDQFGLKVAKKIHIENPKDLNTLDVLALTYEQTGKISEAVSYREEISKLDPWNAENYLALGKDYRAQGDLIKSKKMLDKILSFASGKQVAEQARIDLA